MTSMGCALPRDHDGLMNGLRSKAEDMDLDTSWLDDVDIENPKDRDAAVIALLRALFVSMSHELSRKTEELERIYDGFYQTFHDMGEPAKNLVALSRMILDDVREGREIDEEYARVTHDTAMYQREMLDQLRDFMAVRKKMDEETEEFSVSDAANRAREMLKAQLEEAGAEVDVQSDMRMVKSRMIRWVRIFVNLFKNAINYNRSETPTVKVYQDGDSVFVEDNGIGMTEEQAEHAFELFSRLSDRADMADGTGSGLYQVANLLWDEDVDLSVESEPGKGTTFELSFSSID